MTFDVSRLTSSQKCPLARQHLTTSQVSASPRRHSGVGRGGGSGSLAEVCFLQCGGILRGWSADGNGVLQHHLRVHAAPGTQVGSPQRTEEVGDGPVRVDDHAGIAGLHQGAGGLGRSDCLLPGAVLRVGSAQREPEQGGRVRGNPDPLDQRVDGDTGCAQFDERPATIVVPQRIVGMRGGVLTTKG